MISRKLGPVQRGMGLGWGLAMGLGGAPEPGSYPAPARRRSIAWNASNTLRIWGCL